MDKPESYHECIEWRPDLLLIGPELLSQPTGLGNLPIVQKLVLDWGEENNGLNSIPGVLPWVCHLSPAEASEPQGHQGHPGYPNARDQAVSLSTAGTDAYAKDIVLNEPVGDENLDSIEDGPSTWHDSGRI